MKRLLKYAVLTALAVLLLVAAYFFTVRSLDRNHAEAATDLEAVATEPSTPLETPLRLAAHFDDGERFYLKLPLRKGGELLAFCDTGGGISMLIPGLERRRDLAVRSRYGVLKGLLPIEYVHFDDLVGDRSYPRPQPLPSLVLRNPFLRVTEPYLLKPPLDGELEFMTKSMPDMEAFLGQGFFVGQSWTFDYLRQEIWVGTPLPESTADDPEVQRLGFKRNQHQVKLYGHPSMTIEIEGEAIDVLFDTGATMVLSDEGRQLLETDRRTLGGSFIAVSLYEKWRVEHPEWKHYPKADLAGDIIEVPRVKLGGHEVGPVRFATRPDRNWSHGMIHSMDRVVRGAVGGTLLRHFTVTADYNSDLIRFARDP
ncbi:MAG: hypothetical protein GC161_12940 [Planctomycetaceae bacterium]|nr:hypothetical protein [Planctomycetaceae bacterium]